MSVRGLLLTERYWDIRQWSSVDGSTIIFGVASKPVFRLIRGAPRIISGQMGIAVGQLGGLWRGSSLVQAVGQSPSWVDGCLAVSYAASAWLGIIGSLIALVAGRIGNELNGQNLTYL